MASPFQKNQKNPDVPGVEDVDPKELWEQKAILKEKLTLIDVRRPDEYTGELGHVPGATLLTLDFLPQQINELPKENPLVFICRSGARSARATAFAHEHGFTNVYNMLGGMLLWNQLGLEVEGRNE